MTPEQFIEKIKSLQSLEKELYINIGNFDSNTEQEYKDKLVSTVNSITLKKENLTNELTKLYPNVLLNFSNDLDEIINYELELNDKKESINKKKLNINNLRLTEINTYFGDKYKAKYIILILVSFFTIPIILIGILKNRYILSKNLSQNLMYFVLIIAFIVIFPKIIDNNRRNNMVYNEYDFPFNPKNKSNPYIDEDLYVSLDSSSNNLPDCVGSECCIDEFMSYDENTKTCKEAFISGQTIQTYNNEYTKY